jgi:hypothetical protein
MRSYFNTFAGASKGLIATFLVLSALAVGMPAHASSPTVLSAKITGPNTVSLSFSEQVNTSPTDYSGFSGSLAGRNVVSVNGSGSSNVTLLLDGSAFPANASGGLVIGPTLVGTFDSAPLSNTTQYSGAVTPVADGQTPALSSVQISSSNPGVGLASGGGTITFMTDEPITSPVVSINGSTVSATGQNDGPYTAAYSVPLNSGSAVTFGLTLTDLAGNSTQLLLTSQYSSAVASTPSQALAISEITAIGATSSPTPNYTFMSTGSGKITYFGDCSSEASTAVVGENNITFNPLSNGTHSNCYITVSDSLGNNSNLLAVTPFTVNLAGQTTTPVTSTPVSTPATTSAVSPVSSAYKFNNPINAGDSGPDVTALQETLKARGFYTGPVTGYYGALTKTAVESYQTSHGLSAIGNVGPATRALLNNTQT